MKGNILFLVFIVVLRINSIAQIVDLKWTGYINTIEEFNVSFIGVDNRSNAFYSLRQEKQDYYLLKSDVENKEIFNRKINISELSEINKDKYRIIDLGVLKDKFIVLILSHNEKLNKEQIFIQDISFEGELISAIKLISTKDGNDKININLSISSDSNRAVLCMTVPRQKKIKKSSFEFRIYNHKLDELYSKEVYLSEEENKKYKEIKVEKVLIDNSGEVFISGIKMESIWARQEYALWYLNKTSDQVNSIIIGKENLYDYTLTSNSLGQALFVGFYEDEGEKNYHRTGYFYGKLNAKNQTIDSLKFVKIPPDIQAAPYKADSYTPELRIFPKKDGGQIWIYEYIWTYKNNSRFGNLFVLSIAKDGSLIYAKKIPKMQTKLFGVFISGEFNNYYSYLSVFDKSNDKLTIVFNDSKKNSTNINEHASQLLSISNRVLVSVVIDDKGIAAKHIAKVFGDDKTILCPPVSLQNGNNKAVVLGLVDNKVYIGRLVLE